MSKGCYLKPEETCTHVYSIEDLLRTAQHRTCDESRYYKLIFEISNVLGQRRASFFD